MCLPDIRTVKFWELLDVRNQKLASGPSTCEKKNSQTNKQQKQKIKTKIINRDLGAFSHTFCTFTYIQSWCVRFCVTLDGREVRDAGDFVCLTGEVLDAGDFVCLTGEIRDAGDFICLAGEREKDCLGGRLPLNAVELTALQILLRQTSLEFFWYYIYIHQKILRHFQVCGFNRYFSTEGSVQEVYTQIQAYKNFVTHTSRLTNITPIHTICPYPTTHNVNATYSQWRKLEVLSKF